MKPIELVFLVTNEKANVEINGKVTEGVKKEVELKTDRNHDIDIQEPLYDAIHNKLDRIRWDETSPNLDYDYWNPEGEIKW